VLPLVIIPLAGQIGENTSFGNQLFQLSFGLYLRQVAEINVRFYLRRAINGKDRSWKESDSPLISELLVPGETIGTTNIAELTVRTLTKIDSLSLDDSVQAVNSLTQRHQKNYFKVARGYFQDYRYVDPVRDELLNRLRRSQKFQHSFKSRNDCVSVHVRCGDYISSQINRSIYGMPSVDYYVQATKRLLQSSQTKSVIIVSDEPELAWNLIGCELLKIQGVSISVSSGTSLEDFLLLSTSRAIVMSNSTYCWWAAWVAYHQNSAEVIYPQPWYADKSFDSRGLSFPHWCAVAR
jgi:hypothetical protein